jgi:hypothetical protein
MNIITHEVIASSKNVIVVEELYNEFNFISNTIRVI